jgi:hypothetical protein
MNSSLSAAPPTCARAGAPAAGSRRARRFVFFPHLALAAAAATLAGGCMREGDNGAGRRSRTAPVPLTVSRASRANLAVVGRDMLSDTATILGVYPEPDGDAVAFTFADPHRRVTAGLALTQRRDSAAALLWPDSVRAVWWSAPHAIAFTTASGTGVHVVVDVHAESASVTLDTAARPPAAAVTVGAAPPALDGRDPTVVRAAAYIDSLRVQPAGRPQGSVLRYQVAAMRVAPDGRLGAFYVIATDSANRRFNPAWYAIDVESGSVTPIDEIVGPVASMPGTAAGWAAGARFFYTKEKALWEADVKRGGAAATGADSTRIDSTGPDSMAGS